VLLLLSFAALPAVALAQQAGDTLAIIDVRGSALKLYASSSGKQRIAKIPVADLDMPLPVLEKADTGLLLIEAGGVAGWVKPMGIKTNNMPRLVSVCDKTGARQRVAGERMIGEDCGKKQ